MPRQSLPLRYLPPVASPLSLRSIAAGFSGGDVRSELARLLATEYGYQWVTLTSSGTSALELSLRAAMTTTGRSQVALPAYACFDLITAAWGAGATVAFYDIDPQTFGPVASSIAEACEGSAATVLVHPFGIPQPSEAIRDVCREAGAALVHDLAQADGALFGGRPLAQDGEMAILSFGRGKGWAGGGGALLSRAKPPGTLPQPVEHSVRDAALGMAQWALGRPGWYALPSRVPGLALGDTSLRAPRVATAMPANQARMVYSNRHFLERERSLRRRNAARLRAAVPSNGTLRGPDISVGASPGWLRLPLLATSSHALTDARRLGILRSYPRSLPDVAREAGVPIANPGHRLPGSALLVEQVITVPTHGLLSVSDLVCLEAWLQRQF